MLFLEYTGRTWAALCTYLTILRRKTLPFMVTVLFIVYSVTPFSLSFVKEVAILLPLIPICFWLIHLPERMPIGILFLLGVIMDVLYNYPIGLHSLLFMLLVGGTRLYRERWSKYGIWVWEMALFVLILCAYVSILTIFLMLDRGIGWDIHKDMLRIATVLLLYVMCAPILWLCIHYSD